ncbi:MAG: hypothetical protein MJZ15_09285 [Bacteroidales bacterium]|nr:hypothetical protein [Bacteroidales bacterium]
MTRKTDSLIIILLLMVLCVSSKAQNSTASPYSMFGVGLPVVREDATAAGMGHASVALAPSEWVNVSNPAGLSNLDSLTFYFNFQMKGFYDKLTNANEQQSVYSANIDGITMAFRITKWWGSAIGYAPYSSVGYNLSDEQFITGTGERYKIQYTGSGGLSRAYWNHSISLWKKHIVLGAGVGALWGSFNKKETALFATLNGENIYNTKKYTCNNLFFEYGIQFNFDIGQNNFRIGGVFNDKRYMRTSYDHIVSNDLGANLFFDNTTAIEEFAVPRSVTGGIAYTRKKFTLTGDYKYSEWGSLQNVKFGENVRYADCWSAGGGFEYRAGEPDDPFYKRMRYRLGYYYSTENMVVHHNRFDEFGVTAGLTVPLGRYRNALVISYEHVTRGAAANGLVKEKLKSLKVALNIRETWFKKAKFD